MESIRNDDLVVWYPHKPVYSVNYTHGAFKERLGYRFPYFEIELDASLLNDLGWNQHIQKIWRLFSEELDPFYGEVRILKNAIAGNTSYFSDSLTESSPTRSGFWTGIPIKPGIAMVIGKDYINEWSEFKNKAIERKGLHYLEYQDWESNSSLLDIIAPPPKSLSHSHIVKMKKLKKGGYTMHYNCKYPKFWPFRDIFIPNGNFNEYDEKNFEREKNEKSFWTKLGFKKKNK